MKARSLALLVALTTLLAGCGTPGGDSGDNTKKAEESKKNSAKIDVAKEADDGHTGSDVGDAGQFVGHG